MHWFTIKSFFIRLLTLFHILFYAFNNSLYLIKKFICLVSSKYLAYPLIFGSFIHNGLALLSYLWPIKYLKSFLPNETLLDINIFYTLLVYIYWILRIVKSLSFWLSSLGIFPYLFLPFSLFIYIFFIR